MKRGLLIIATALLAACAPEPRVDLADGTSVPLERWDGRWLVINYWAEWCGPCRDEIPELNELHHEAARRGVVVLGVNWDGLEGGKLSAVVERMGIEFPVLTVDPYQQYGYDRAQQLPVTVLINPARAVVDVLMGPQSVASIMAAISGAAADPPHADGRQLAEAHFPAM